MLQLYQSTCEFCIELGGRPGARFAGIYPRLRNRVIAREGGLVALPTLGQLFPGSLLLVPEQHYETCADLPGPIADRVSELVSRLSATSRRFGQPAFFEHGARHDTGGSCGIYHAHLHLVPLPGSLSPGDLFPAHLSVAPDLPSALHSLRGCSQYLLAGNEYGVVYARVADMATPPGSQYFRRLLAERFGSTRPWDWRAFKTPEPDVLTTLAAFDAFGEDWVNPTRIIDGLLQPTRTFETTMGSVHGDLHPKNVVLDKSNEPYIIDFGWARSDGAIVVDYILMDINLRSITLPSQVQEREILEIARFLTRDRKPTSMQPLLSEARGSDTGGHLGSSRESGSRAGLACGVRDPVLHHGVRASGSLGQGS